MSKAASARNERILNDLRTTVDGNNVCADCNSPQPRWASWNLGIFLCVKCATIHRSMGSHVSKVKSLTLDTWTKEQVDAMRLAGNVRSNQTYCPDPSRNPPPLNIEGDERDSQLQRYIENKYKNKAFMRAKKVEVDDRPPAKRPERAGPSDFTRSKVSPQTPTFAFSSGSGGRSASPEPLVATKPSRLAPQSTGFAQAGNHISRAATAPIPAASRSTTPVVHVNPYNPFNRSMTASVGVPASGYKNSGYTAPQAPLAQQGYSQQSLSPYMQPSTAQMYGQQQMQPIQQHHQLAQNFQQQVQPQASAHSWRPQSQAAPQRPVTQSQNDVWGDLAGLSLSSSLSSFSPSQTPSLYPAYQHQQPSVLSFVSQPTGTNPFLRSTSYPQVPSPQPQPMPSGSILGTASLVPAFQPQSQFGMQNFGSSVGRNPFLSNSTSAYTNPSTSTYQSSFETLGNMPQQQAPAATANYFANSAYQ